MQLFFREYEKWGKKLKMSLNNEILEFEERSLRRSLL